jgi:hypothetical protein
MSATRVASFYSGKNGSLLNRRSQSFTHDREIKFCGQLSVISDKKLGEAKAFHAALVAAHTARWKRYGDDVRAQKR